VRVSRWRIKDVRAHLIETLGMGGNYTSQSPGHWMTDERQANPLAFYPERTNLRSGTASADSGILLEIETADGTIGLATGSGGIAVCSILEQGLSAFLVGSDVRDIARLWDEMYRATLPYGRKGVALLAVSIADLALWDLLGHLYGEPVFRLAGGATKQNIHVYGTGPDPVFFKNRGFLGAKVPFPYGPADGRKGLERNIQIVAAHRDAVGAGFQLMIDCFMGLDVGYALDFARATQSLNLYWIEEALHPDDYDGYRQLRRAAPWVRWVAGEHEYTRWGFRELIRKRAVDIIQPDLMWAGGFSEALHIASLASAFDMTVVPHAGGIYSYHYAMARPSIPFAEYCITSPKGDEVTSVFGGMFDGEPLASDGTITLSEAPGWGLRLNRNAVRLKRFST
jgi:L-alanine-DL-glutamate epimerase-like enolase superfamily enzyme